MVGFGEFHTLIFCRNDIILYLHSQNVELSRYDIVQSYMVFG